MATFADPQAVAAALKKTGSTANWLGDGTDTAPVDYAPVSHPQPPDKPPVQIPQDPDKLPPAAQVQAPKPAVPQPPPAIANDQPHAPAEPPPGEVTVTVKTPRQQAAQPAPVPDQQPAPAPAQGQPAPNPYTEAGDGVEDLPLDLSQGTRRLQGEIAAGKGREIELQGQRGEIREGLNERQVAIESGRSEAGAEGVARQRDVADDTRETGQAYRERVEKEIDDMKTKMGKPPFDTVGLVFGIVSAVAAANGKDKVAVAMQNLGKAVNYKMQKWAGGVEGNQQAAEGFGKLINYNELQGKDNLAAEEQVAKASAAEFDSALDAARAQAKTDDEIAAIDLTKNQLRVVALQAEAQRRAKAAAAARRAQIYNAIGAAKSAEEREAYAAANGQVGQDVLRDYLKTQGQTADVAKKTMDVEKTVADIGKTQAEATAAQADAAKKLRDAQKGTPDKQPMTEGDYKADAIVSGFVPAYQRLQSVVARGDEINRGATKETWLPDLFRSEQTLQQRADIKALGLGVLRAESGANIPVHEIENKFEALPVNSGDPQVRAQGLRDLLTAAAALDRQGRIQQAASKVRAAQASANGGQEPTVRVIRADGKTLDVPRSRATALIKAAPAGAYKIQN